MNSEDKEPNLIVSIGRNLLSMCLPEWQGRSGNEIWHYIGFMTNMLAGGFVIGLRALWHKHATLVVCAQIYVFYKLAYRIYVDSNAKLIQYSRY